MLEIHCLIVRITFRTLLSLQSGTANFNISARDRRRQYVGRQRTESVPSFSFSGDTDTGLFRSAANTSTFDRRDLKSDDRHRWQSQNWPPVRLRFFCSVHIQQKGNFGASGPIGVRSEVLGHMIFYCRIILRDPGVRSGHGRHLVGVYGSTTGMPWRLCCIWSGSGRPIRTTVYSVRASGATTNWAGYFEETLLPADGNREMY